MPSPRAGHAAVVVDGVMYVFGGFTGQSYLNDLYALQLSTQRWFKFDNVGPSPHCRSAHAMASDGTRVFVLGGYSAGTRSDELSIIHVFDTKHIKYPEPERNAVNPNQKTTQLAGKSSAGPPTQEQTQHSKSSSSEAHGAFRLRNAELVVSRDQQVGQYEKKEELTNMRAQLEAKESELEAFRSRLTDAENSLSKSKAEADTLRAQTATGSE